MRRLASARARAVLEVSWNGTDEPLADNTVITFKGGYRGPDSAAPGAGLEDEIRRL